MKMFVSRVSFLSTSRLIRRLRSLGKISKVKIGLCVFGEERRGGGDGVIHSCVYICTTGFSY